jgi:hypothetical protein
VQKRREVDSLAIHRLLTLGEITMMHYSKNGHTRSKPLESSPAPSFAGVCRTCRPLRLGPGKGLGGSIGAIGSKAPRPGPGKAFWVILATLLGLLGLAGTAVRRLQHGVIVDDATVKDPVPDEYTAYDPLTIAPVPLDPMSHAFAILEGRGTPMAEYGHVGSKPVREGGEKKEKQAGEGAKVGRQACEDLKTRHDVVSAASPQPQDLSSDSCLIVTSNRVWNSLHKVGLGGWENVVQALRFLSQVPGTSWGSMDKARQDEWLRLACDKYFCQPHALRGRGVYKCEPLRDSALADERVASTASATGGVVV